MLYGTLATTAPFYNISTLCNRNKKWKTNTYFRESSKSRSLATPAIRHDWQNRNCKRVLMIQNF